MRHDLTAHTVQSPDGGLIMKQSAPSRIRAAMDAVKRLFRRKKPEQPEDPYAYVTAPKRPRPPARSAAAVADRPED